MSEEVNKEQTKGATQEEITELTDDRLDEAAGGVDATADVPDGIGLSDGEDDSQGARVTWNAVSGD